MTKPNLNQRFTRQYAAIQGCYWMACCAAISYASIYLLDKGYSNSQIGLIMAISNILAVVLQPLAASFADRHKKIELRSVLTVLSTSIILAAVIFVFILSQSFVLSALLVFIITMIIVIQPLMNSLSVAYEDSQIYINFGFARGIGSIAYAVLSTSLGLLLRHFSNIIIPICLCLTITAFTLLVFTFRNINRTRKEIGKVELSTNNSHEEQASSLLEFVKRNKRFMLFLLGVFFIFYNHNTLSVFTIQIIQSYGGDSTNMGIANSIAAISEFPAMFLVNRLLKKYSCCNLIRFAACTFAVKHLIILFASSVSVYYLSQVLQIGSYAIFIPVSVTYVSRLLSRADAVKGQAFITTAITLGSVFASIINGKLLDLTTVNNVLWIGTIVAWIGSIVLFFSVEEVKD